MDAAIFDDIVVRRPTDEADAGPDQWLIDFDGDGVETATLDARMSVGAAQWAGLGADGALVSVEVGAEGATFTAQVGASVDSVRVQVATGERLVAADRFEDGDFAGWRIVDETELGGPADWAVVDGALVEQSGAWSRELTWAGASNPDVWQRGWSPLGDGVFALHKGTYALWEGDKGLDDYMIRATVTAADAEGGVGFMLNWIDEDNHYKLEIDAHANLTTLVKVVDGYESYLNRVRTVYTPGESFELMAVREDDAIQVYIDGHAIFAEAVEDRDLGAGQAGVYAWKSAGASFDDVAIVDLSEPEAPTLGVFGLLDALVREGQPQTYDLAALFPGASGFSVTTADGDVVAATIADGVLTLDPQARGHADLVLTGLAADGSAIAESFRAIVVGEHAYTFAVMPDTQSYTSTSNPEVRALFGQMADWLLAHQESLNIAHMIHVGDIVEFGAPGQWEIAEAAIEKLDGKLSYTLAVGNHDQQRPGFSSAFSFESDIDAYFTPEQVGATPAQGGGTYDGFDVGEDTFANGSDYAGSIRNHFTTLTAPDGTDWLILSLEFGAPDDVLRWAGEVIEGHLDHRVIIDTHSWNGGDKRVDPTTEPLTGENGGWGYAIRANPRNVNDGEDMWRELASKYPNIVFTFNGHNFLDGAETVTSLAAGDNPVLQIMVNYQNGISGEITGAGDPSLGGRGGNGAMRLVVIDPENGEVTTHTKFVGLDRYFERVDHQETFTGLDLGAPETITIAKAGGTLVVEAEGLEATVALDPSASLEARATVYAWFDADGEKLGETDGAPLEVALKPGLHRLTLVATDAEGNVSRDAKTVIVEAEGGALLTDTFDDGDAAGWTSPAAAAPAFATLGTDLGFALPALGAVEQVALTLAFDSHWRPFDAMTGEVLVSFDGGATLAQVLRFGSDNTNDADFRDQRVEIDFLAPLSAEGVTLAWRLS
ncbi:hypothetical protein, partial [Rubrimonas sp.]|uniref:hypothetical protein n=1 Tax=Rubrimonas sp. TaxID=2036015 RepID=UPI002FDE164E